MKKLLSIFCTLVIMLMVLPFGTFVLHSSAASNSTTITANYTKLRQYIEKNGRTNSSSEKYIDIKWETVDEISYSYTATNKDDGIEFDISLLGLGSKSGIVHFNKFLLTDTSNMISCDVTHSFTKNGTNSIAMAKAQVDRTKYRKSYVITYDITYSESTTVKNSMVETAASTLYLLCGESHIYLYKNLGFGLTDLGFTSFLEPSDCKNHTFGAYSKVDNSNHARTCTACGYKETKAHTWNGGTQTKAPNCKDYGTKTFTCTTCNATKTENIAKTTTHTYGAWTQTKAPTCTAKGTETRTCSVCSKAETRDVKATGHKWGSYVTTKEATCTANGTQTRTCSACQKTENKDIKALGHKFSNPTVTKEPTCTEKGEEKGTCTRCDKETTNAIPAKGHKVENYTVITDATCTAKGEEEGTCKTCNEKIKREVEMIAHTYGEAIVTKEPTETEKGTSTKTCTACGGKVEEEIPALGTKTENTDNDANVDNNETNEESDATLWIVIGVLAAAIIAAVVVVVLKKKKA